jgi:hypothetical protein
VILVHGAWQHKEEVVVYVKMAFWLFIWCVFSFIGSFLLHLFEMKWLYEYKIRWTKMYVFWWNKHSSFRITLI